MERHLFAFHCKRGLFVPMHPAGSSSYRARYGARCEGGFAPEASLVTATFIPRMAWRQPPRSYLGVRTFGDLLIPSGSRWEWGVQPVKGSWRQLAPDSRDVGD
jgi:hypothetical protein